MNRIMLVLAVLWLSLRDRWHRSLWNPWGLASARGRHRSTADVVAILERQGPAFLQTLTGTGETPPNPPKPPVA